MKARLLVIAALLGSSGAGCVEGEPESESSDVSATTSVSAKVPGMTVWFDWVAVPDFRFDTTVWVLRGRTSKNLESAFSFASDDEFGETTVTSSRKLEVVVDRVAMAHLLEGHPIIVEIKTTTGTHKQYFASIQMAPRFGSFSGSSKIFVKDELAPVWMGSDVVWRGKASLSSGVNGLAVKADDAATEGVVGSGKNVAFDLTWPNLMLAADPLDERVHFSANGTSGALAKKAAIELTVSKLELSEQVPEQHLECDAAVLACLEALPAGAPDASSCGTGAAVRHCQFQLPAQAPSAFDFAADSRSFLGAWYGEHGADAEGSGGLSLIEAQAGVHTSGVSAVTNAEEDPEGHDLSKFIVFSHPDVVFPGSDIVWFGAYDKKTGALVAVYDFN